MRRRVGERAAEETESSSVVVKEWTHGFRKPREECIQVEDAVSCVRGADTAPGEAEP